MAEQARLFMTLSGPSGIIEGESKVLGRIRWIELDDWRWKVEAVTGSGDSSSLGDGKTMSAKQLAFSKLMDRASLSMLTAMGKGDLLSATIEIDDNSQDYGDLSVVLKNVRIINYELNTELGDKALAIKENWEFDYESVVFKYKPDRKSGLMQVTLDRPPGQGADPSVRDKMPRFKELTDDMSVQELQPIFDKIIEDKRSGRNKKPEPEPESDSKSGKPK